MINTIKHKKHSPRPHLRAFNSLLSFHVLALFSFYYLLIYLQPVAEDQMFLVLQLNAALLFGLIAFPVAALLTHGQKEDLFKEFSSNKIISLLDTFFSIIIGYIIASILAFSWVIAGFASKGPKIHFFDTYQSISTSIKNNDCSLKQLNTLNDFLVHESNQTLVLDTFLMNSLYHIALENNCLSENEHKNITTKNIEFVKNNYQKSHINMFIENTKYTLPFLYKISPDKILIEKLETPKDAKNIISKIPQINQSGVNK